MAENRTQMVPVRFTAKGVDRLDELRGAWTRSEYIRRSVAKAAKEGLKGPEQTDW